MAGKAGRGPRLRGREWDKNYLFKVTFEGIPNSSMPAWKDRLTEQEIGAVVAYVLTLSKLTSDSAEAQVPAAPVASSPAAASEAPPTKSESSPVDGSFFGNAEKGKALFFDSSNDWHCGACHKIGGTGAGVGPELNGVRSKAVKDLFIDIVLPSVHLSADRPFLSITTKSGEQIQGVKAEESATHIKLYDIGELACRAEESAERPDSETGHPEPLGHAGEVWGDVYRQATARHHRISEIAAADLSKQ